MLIYSPDFQRRYRCSSFSFILFQWYLYGGYLSSRVLPVLLLSRCFCKIKSESRLFRWLCHHHGRCLFNRFIHLHFLIFLRSCKANALKIEFAYLRGACFCRNTQLRYLFGLLGGLGGLRGPLLLLHFFKHLNVIFLVFMIAIVIVIRITVFI